MASDELRRRVERAGFRVFERRIEYVTFTGERVSERRLTGYLPGDNVKISYSEGAQSGGRLSLTVEGGSATRGLAERIETLGGVVDLDEGKRLYAVFRGVSRRRAGELIERLFSEKPANVGSRNRRGYKAGNV